MKTTFWILIVLWCGIAPTAACRNDPRPVTPNSPVLVKCQGGGYCDANSEVCGIAGHACGENDCCFITDNGRAFGGARKRKATEMAPR